MYSAEIVISELDAIGRYRLRIVENKGGRYLDIREYLAREEFTGFTRKGIRLKPAEVIELMDSLSSDPDCQDFLESAPAL